MRTYRYIATGAGASVAGTTTDTTASAGNALLTTGWSNTNLLSGTTAQRPQPGDPDMPAQQPLPAAIHYLDLTLNIVVVSDGIGFWRNPATGAVV